MFRRLSDSLMAPSKIARYYKESFWKTFLFFLFLLLIMMVQNTLALYSSSLLDGNVKKEIRSEFVGEEIPYEIIDGKLVNVNGDVNHYYINNLSTEMNIIFTEDLSNIDNTTPSLNIIFNKDGVYVSATLIAQKIFEYSEFDYLVNLDFSDPNVIRDISFWDNIFNITEITVNNFKPIYMIIGTISNLIYWFAWLIIFMLIIALFSKFKVSGYIKFRDLFKIAVYSLTPLVFCIFFANFLGIKLLLYLGYILAAIYNSITVNEILKNILMIKKEGPQNEL